MRLHDYARSAAALRPDALAVSGPDGTLTYRQLDDLATRQAEALYTAGVRHGSRVVLWSGKNVHAIALMQAVLRLGAVYVPVTEANPPARVERIAVDCAAALVVLSDGPAQRVAREGSADPFSVPTAALADLASQGPTTVSYHDGELDDPAYILYTSGSTGAPKGVCLSHRNAVAFVEWAGDLLAITSVDRLSNHAPFNFDLSVFDLYTAFRAGASVHLVPAELAYAPSQLVQFLRDERISVWYSVPSAVILMMRDGRLLDGARPPALRVCIVAGESMPIRHAQELKKSWPQVRLLNWYGPTETNVCTSYEMTEADLARTRPLPIGTGACGDSITLDLLGDAGQGAEGPVGAGPGDEGSGGAGPADEGEIVVDGPTVMLGYWGQAPHAGPYRTGDIGRFDADGNLEYLGRRDDMVKVRGHRIEPGEIEAVLGSHAAVGSVAVIVVGSGVDSTLHAVVVVADGMRSPSLLELKKLCAQRLPNYMIVDSLHVVEKLPLTPNGKTDRTALAAAVVGGGP